jgi:hypothetical protein
MKQRKSQFLRSKKNSFLRLDDFAEFGIKLQRSSERTLISNDNTRPFAFDVTWLGADSYNFRVSCLGHISCQKILNISDSIKKM